jgi:hypothetical protein
LHWKGKRRKSTNSTRFDKKGGSDVGKIFPVFRSGEHLKVSVSDGLQIACFLTVPENVETLQMQRFAAKNESRIVPTNSLFFNGRRTYKTTRFFEKNGSARGSDFQR